MNQAIRAMSGRLTIGFDLDMTLVNSYDGIALALSRTLEEQNCSVDLSEIYANLGVPLKTLLAVLAPGVSALNVQRRYAEIYAQVALPKTTLMTGAAEVLRDIQQAGGRILIGSAKQNDLVRLVLQSTHLADLLKTKDVVAGGIYGDQKSDWLRANLADVYVGDRPSDMLAARQADCVAIGVPTGHNDRAELLRAGADLVFEDLTELRPWVLENIRHGLL